MSPTTLGIIGIVVLIIFFIIRMPVGMSMALLALSVLCS